MDDSVLPADAAIGRVALRVADVASVADFYESVVGLQRLSVESEDAPLPAGVDDPIGPDDVVLGSGGTPLLYLLAAPDAADRDERAAGLFHTAIRVPTRAALGSAIERLGEADALTGAADHLVSEAVYARDPEGNGVEVYVDRPRAEWPVDGDRVVIDTQPLDVDALVARSDGSETVPAGSDVGHVHLEVTDLEAARGFYVDALGFGVTRAYGEDALFLAAGGYHHHVGLNTWEQRTAPAGDSRGIAWFEVVVPDASALDAVRERLDDAGFEVATGSGRSTLRTSDADGIDVRVRTDQTPTAD